MSELNEKEGEPQEQPSDRAPIPAQKLKEILGAHRKWVESGGKEGERADLGGANLQEAFLVKANLQEADLREANLFKANLQKAYLGEANLQGAKLQGANLREATGFTASQVKLAKNWELALYSDDSLKKLGLKPDHNEQVRKKLAEMEKEKKASGAKP